MPKPVRPNEALSINTSTGKKLPSGDKITIYADNSVWNESKGHFEKTEDLVRK